MKLVLIRNDYTIAVCQTTECLGKIQCAKSHVDGSSLHNSPIYHQSLIDEQCTCRHEQQVARHCVQCVLDQGRMLAQGTPREIAANEAGVAVVRVTLTGFDTHSGHPGTQARLLSELAGGVVALFSGKPFVVSLLGSISEHQNPESFIYEFKVGVLAYRSRSRPRRPRARGRRPILAHGHRC